MSGVGSGHKQLGQLLLQAGVLDELQLRSALGHQRQWGGRLGRILVELKFLDEATLASSLARQLGMESVRITGEGIDAAVVSMLPQQIAERYWVFPLSFKESRGGGELTVALADPTNLAAVEDIRFQTGKRINVVVAPESDIEAAIKRFYYGDTNAQLAGAPAGDEIVESPPIELEELAEIEPLPIEPQAPAQMPTADPLSQFFDDLTPTASQPPTAAPVSHDLFDSPGGDIGEPEPTYPEIGVPPLAVASAVEAPPPLQIEPSAFDSPQLGGLFDSSSALPEPIAGFSESVQPGRSTAVAESSYPSGLDFDPTPTHPRGIPRGPQPTAAPPLVDESSPSGFDFLGPAETAPPPSEIPLATQPVVTLTAALRTELASYGYGEPDPPAAEPAAEPPNHEEAPSANELLSSLDGLEAASPLAAGTMAMEAAESVLSEAPPEFHEVEPPPFEAPPAFDPTAAPDAPQFEAAPAAEGAVPAPPNSGEPPSGLTDGELQILDSLEARVAVGTAPPQVIKPGQLVSALIRLMIRKELLSEGELIEELQKL